MAMHNPFKPTAGATPPLLIGREQLVEDFELALEEGPGAPERLQRITGLRGVGKTALLTAFSNVARSRGWLVIDETATPGLVERVLAELAPTGRQVRGIGLPSVGVAGIGSASLGKVELTDPQRPALLRAVIGERLTKLERRGRGVLITIDEVQAGVVEELRDVAVAYQHLTREDRNVALVLAGLPSMISELLNHTVLTFLRRAYPVNLGMIPVDAIDDSLRRTLEASGRSIGAAALAEASRATNGYPYLVQLVGYQLWRAADANGTVSDAAAERAVERAMRQFGDVVHAPAIADLSAVDRAYVLAMARLGPGPVHTSQIAEALGKSAKYGSVYRERLLQAGIIEASAHGMVDFALPYLREYLLGRQGAIDASAGS